MTACLSIVRVESRDNMDFECRWRQIVVLNYFVDVFFSSVLAGQHLILETDPEKGNEYVFDNPGFKGM